MNDALLDSVRRYVHAHAGPLGVALTPVPGLTTIRATSPSGLDYAMSRPLACLVPVSYTHLTLPTIRLG